MARSEVAPRGGKTRFRMRLLAIATTAPLIFTCANAVALAQVPTSPTVTQSSAIPSADELERDPTSNPDETTASQASSPPTTVSPTQTAEMQRPGLTTTTTGPSVSARTLAGCRNIVGYTLCGDILDKYDSLGGTSSFLGLPRSSELVNPDGFGRRTMFQGGTIYWSGATGAHPVGGAIGDKWGALGHESQTQPLKYPTSDELFTSRGGKRQVFQGGTIYWSEATGAHPVWGVIGERWGQQQFENGALMFPSSDEIKVSGGAYQNFQGGSIYYSGATGAKIVWGAIKANYLAAGGPTGSWGWPTNEEHVPWFGGFKQNFQNREELWRGVNFTWGYEINLTSSITANGDSTMRGVTWQQVKQELQRCFTCNFPIQNATNAYPSVGAEMNLRPYLAGSAPVKVVQVGNQVDWTFEALPGHFDDAGSVIAFRLYSDGTRMNLQVKAGVVRDRGSIQNALNRRAAQQSWQGFINQLGANICAYQRVCTTN